MAEAVTEATGQPKHTPQAPKEVAADQKKAKKAKKKALDAETSENTPTTPVELKSLPYTKLKKHMLEIGVSQQQANKCANKTALLELFDKHRAALGTK